MTVSAEAIAFQTPIGLADPKTVRWGNDLVASLRRLQAVVQQRSTVSDVGALAAAISSAQNDLVVLQDAIAGLDAGVLTDQQQFLINLVGEVSDVLGSLAEFNRTAFGWAQRAAASGLNALVNAHLTEATGRTQVINEQLVRETETGSLALSRNAVNASFGLSQATVDAIIAAYAAGDTATAQSLNTVTTTVAGNTASVTTLTAAVNGINARWGVAVNIQGQVVGLVQLDGSASGSTFTVVADKMQVAQPSITGGDPVPVFVIANVGGTPKLALRGDMIADGSITAQRLSVSSLSSIVANIGTVTAGVIQSSDAKFKIDLNNKTIDIVP